MIIFRELQTSQTLQQYSAYSCVSMCSIWSKYEGHLESKERFAIQIFIDNRKEKEYAGFMTHLHLLLHIATLEIEALVVP